MELENDRFDNNDTASDNDETVGSNGEPEREGFSTDTNSFIDTATDTVPDSVENDNNPFADTETVEDTTADNTENILSDSSDDTVSDSEIGTDSSSDNYEVTVESSELEYIEYLLNTQIDDFQSIKNTVSGNSVNVIIDSGTKETLTTMEENQRTAINNQSTIILFLSCVLLVLVLDFMSRSAKRVIKGFMDKQ